MRSSGGAPRVRIERHELENGLRVCLAPDPSVPVVAVNLCYGVGSRDEKPGHTGLAHLFEHLMFQGSANVVKGEHFQLVQAAGGRANAATGYDRTIYHELLPSHELELALWLEADRLSTLLSQLDQERLDNQRDVVRNERRLRIDNQPYGDADERLHGLLYPAGHPYAHEIIGSMEDLALATLDDVSRFFAAYYAPNNAVLAIAGDFEPDHAFIQIESHFGPISANPRLPPPPAFPAPVWRSEPLRAEVVGAVPLARVYLAYPIPSFGTEGFDAADVVADILGRGRGSRLYSGLVRQDELAQDISAWVYPLVGDPARLTIEATARPGVPAEKLLDRLLEEVEALAVAGPSPSELERVQIMRQKVFETAIERRAERAEEMALNASVLDDPDRLNTELQRYGLVDGEAVRRIVEGNLRPDRAVVLTYRPAG